MNAYDWLPQLRAGTIGHEVAAALKLRRREACYACPGCHAPSLEVLEQTFTCSRCGIHGDLIALVMVTQQTDLHGAVEWLLARAIEEGKERRKTERRWLEAEQRFQATFEQAAVGLALVAPDGYWLLVNQKLCDIVGYPAEQLLERSLQDITHPDDVSLDLKQRERVMAGDLATYSTEKRYIRSDNSVVWINLTVSLVREASGAPRYFIAAVEEISERKRAEQALRESEERYRTLVETSPDGILLTDLNGNILIANRRAARLHDYDGPEEMVGLRVFALVIPTDRGRAVEDARRTFRQGEVRDIGYTMLRKDGSTFPGEISASLLRDTDGQPVGTIGIIRDITVRKRADDALRHRAMHDSLTDLPNRILFGDRLEQAIHAARRTAAALALLLLDLDDFKDINDAFGHHYGDLLLQKVAMRLRTVVRDSDTVARLGGDEFAFLLPATDAAGALRVARKVAMRLRTPEQIEAQDLCPGGSIGIAVYPYHGQDSASLLRHADVAMYTAKRERSGCVVFSFDLEPARLEAAASKTP